METDDLTRAMLDGELADPPRLDVARVRALGLRHRRNRRLTAAGAAAAVVALVAGALLGIPALVDRADGPAPVKPDRVNTQPPARGTCWRTDPSLLTKDYTSDDSPRVPCSSSHTLETVITYDLDEPTVAKLEELGPLCSTQARIYVGSDLVSWVPWNALIFLPSKAQVARGASWARCDVAIASQDKFDPQTLTSHTGSVKDAVTEDPTDVWACTNQSIRTGQDRPTRFSDCRRPHRYEATGILILVEGLKSYPSPSQLAAEEGPCTRSLTAEQKAQGLAVKTVWGSPSDLRNDRGGILGGLCWRYRTDSEPMPAMH
jgi:hypothetical protein